ncbi:MAG: hypothetical protein Kow0042_12920 [Calditrichia bacterium]
MKSIVSFLIVVWVGLLIHVGGLSAQAPLGEKLQQRIVESASAELIPVWVFFKDKGGDWEARLPEIEEQLNARAKIRRLRNRPANRLTDYYDVPVNSYYVRQVRQRVQKIRTKSRWLNAVSAEATVHQISALQTLPFVKKIILIGRFLPPEIPQEQPLTPAPTEQIYSLDYGPSLTQNQQIQVPLLHDLGFNGSGVTIAMLDAGFNNLQHQALAPINILHTWDFVNGDSIVWDEPGQMGTGDHGTWTLGTIAGFSPGHLIGPAYGADFLLAKTENTEWERHIEEDHWVAGAEWADSLGADIISSSLGYRDGFTHGEPNYTWQHMNGDCTIVTIGADIAASRGILVVNSAGNEGSSTPSNPNTLVAPADGDSVLAAGAVNSSGQRVYFSSMGPTADGRIKPDVMALGSGVVAPSTASTTGYTSVSGTSFSCPLTAGAAALILQANPNLSNMQIIKAMRNTASNAATPDNSYGWGIVNAYAAAFYYTPQISHIPHHDVEDVYGPYEIKAHIVSLFGLTSDSMKVFYRYDQGNFQTADLQPALGDTFVAQIPGPGMERDISYYIWVKTDSGSVATHPLQAPSELHTFHVGPDQKAPIIIHSPVQRVAYIKWPIGISAEITDNLGVNDSQVWVEWNLNGVVHTPFQLHRWQGDVFQGSFNSDTNQVQVGDVIEYRIKASDLATIPNTAYHPETGYHSFSLEETRGLILVIDDEGTTRGMIEDRGTVIQYDPENTNSATTLIEHYLQKLNFLVTVESVNNTVPANWGQYNLILSVSGENPDPVSSPSYRQALIQHVQNGGKLLIEGGEVGYDAISSPGYPDLAAQVLHITDWNGDDEGPLTLLTNQTQHPLVNLPNLLPASINLDYNSFSGWYDQDAVKPDAQSYIVYQPLNEPGKAGLLIYDDNVIPESAQIVYWAFDFSSITDTTVAKNLLENTVVYLTTEEIITGLDEISEHVPTRTELYPNYPNPFNPQTTVQYALAQAGKVNITVYNNLGQKVVTLLDDHRNAGQHKLIWNAENLGSGVYYIVMKNAGSQFVRKTLLLK